MSGLKILYNLILKNVAKESGQASGILSIGKDVRKLADKKFQRYVTTAQKQGVDLDKLSEQEIKYMMELNKPKAPQVLSNEEAYEFLNKFLNQGKKDKGKVIKGKFGKSFLEELSSADNAADDILVEQMYRTSGPRNLEYDSSFLAEFIAEDAGKVLDDLPIKEQTKFIERAKNALRRNVKQYQPRETEIIKGIQTTRGLGDLFPKQLEKTVTVRTVIEDIKKLKPMDSMKETNKVLRGEGKYKNLSKADREKIAGDESVTDHIFERDIPVDPEDFAYGGVAGMLGERTEYNEGGSSIDKGKKGDSQVLPFDFDELDHDELMHIIKLLQAGEIPKLAQGGVAGLLGERVGLYQGGGPHSRGRGRQSSGMSFSGATHRGGTTGGPPGGGGGRRTPPPKKKTTTVTTGGASPFPYITPKGRRTIDTRPKGDHFLKRFIDHDKFTDQIKFLDTDDKYHQLGGLDFMMRFPGINPNIAKGLATGYQNLTEAARANPDPLGDYTDVMEATQQKAAEEARLNAIGIDAALDPNSALYQQYTGLVDSANLVPHTLKMAEGGPARQNFAMGRRAFLKLLGGVGAGIGALKTGILGFGKGASKQVAKDLTQVPIQNAEGMPAWFKPLVNRVIKEGTETTNLAPNKGGAYLDRQIVHSAKLGEGQEVRVYQNLDDQTINVEYKSADNMGGVDDGIVNLEYRAPQEISLHSPEGSYSKVKHGSKKSVKTKAEFSAEEAFPHGTTGDYKDITMEGSNVVTKVDDLYSDTSALKQFGTNKTLSKKELEIAKQKRKRVNEINNDLGEQNQLLPEPPDYDDFASGGIARMLGE